MEKNRNGGPHQNSWNRSPGYIFIIKTIVDHQDYDVGMDKGFDNHNENKINDTFEDTSNLERISTEYIGLWDCEIDAEIINPPDIFHIYFSIIIDSVLIKQEFLF